MITSTYHTRPDFKLFRGVNNTIDFLIRDIDRQPVTITTAQVIWVTIADFTTSTTLLRTPLTTVLASDGQYRLTIDSVTTSGFALGPLTYTVSMIEAGIETILFTDRDHGPSSAVEVLDGPQPPAPIPVTVQGADFTSTNGGFVAGSYAGAATKGNLTGQHSVALYTSGFTGTLTIQGTVEIDPPTTEGWFTVATLDCTGATGIQPVSFTGNLTWVQFLVSTNTGVTQLVYTN